MMCLAHKIIFKCLDSITRPNVVTISYLIANDSRKWFCVPLKTTNYMRRLSACCSRGGEETPTISSGKTFIISFLLSFRFKTSTFAFISHYFIYQHGINKLQSFIKCINYTRWAFPMWLITCRVWASKAAARSIMRIFIFPIPCTSDFWVSFRTQRNIVICDIIRLSSRESIKTFSPYLMTFKWVLNFNYSYRRSRFFFYCFQPIVWLVWHAKAWLECVLQ